MTKLASAETLTLDNSVAGQIKHPERSVAPFRNDCVRRGGGNETAPTQVVAVARIAHVERPRAAGMRSLARRRNERRTDSTPTHRFRHPQQADEGLIDGRLDPNNSDGIVPAVGNQKTVPGLADARGRSAGRLEQRGYRHSIVRLRDRD